jgi:myosin heavy subunit
MAKLLCTDHEELYNNLLKPRMKAGNNFVSHVRNDDQVSTLMQPPT